MILGIDLPSNLEALRDHWQMVFSVLENEEDDAQISKTRVMLFFKCFFFDNDSWISWNSWETRWKILSKNLALEMFNASRKDKHGKSLQYFWFSRFQSCSLVKITALFLVILSVILLMAKHGISNPTTTTASATNFSMSQPATSYLRTRSTTTITTIKDMCVDFKSVSSDTVSFSSAQYICKGLGGHLSFFKNVHEYRKYLAQIGTDRYRWLGIHRFWVSSSRSYTWKTVTNQEINYFSWASGEPNNAYDDRDCVEFNSDSQKWKNNNCANLYLFSCRFEKDCIE